MRVCPCMHVCICVFYLLNNILTIFSSSVPISGLWKELHPMDVFIIGYGVRDGPCIIKVFHD